MRVLSIDGGGIRGLIPALVLAEIEARTGKRTAELFDLIAGTSTGGILACALARPEARPAAELTRLYETRGPQIFHPDLLHTVFSAGGVLDQRYLNTGLMAALAAELGDTRLSQTVVPIFVTAYDITERRAFFFRTGAARTKPGHDFPLVDVARATAAAPTYFEPARVGGFTLIDGGVFASNPALYAYVDRPASELAVLASLGTGELNRPFAYEDARGWGLLGWARPVVDIMLSSQAETSSFSLEHLLGARYVRLNAPLDGGASDDLDDASPRNLAALRTVAERLIAKETDAIDALCAQLTSRKRPVSTS